MKCDASLFDVHVLMGMQLLIEAIQNDMPVANLDLLHTFYHNIVFDFRIWARTQFQIIIGHIQYIQAIIKDDRKYFRYGPYSYSFGPIESNVSTILCFRKHYGIQFMLDVILEHFTTNDSLSASDAKVSK